VNNEKLLYRILLGYYYIYIDNKKYKIVYPNAHIKYQAEYLYDTIIEDNKYDKTWLTQKEIDLYLTINKIWLPSDNDKITQLNEIIENTKIELYINFVNENKRKSVKKQINQLNSNLESLYQKKNSLNYLSIIEQATTIKNEFLIMNSIYDDNDNLIFTNPYQDSYNHQDLQIFIKEIINSSININDLRLLARSDLWKSYISSMNLEKKFLEINDDYRHLINIHRMYENAKQHPEAPSEQIIDDDDALDGWFIYQNRKIEKEKKKNNILDKVGGNVKNAGEIFYISHDPNERKEILSLNSAQDKKNLEEMIKIHKEGKDVQWKDLSFVRQNVQKQALEKMNDKFKK
jgi:hypothetical protein